MVECFKIGVWIIKNRENIRKIVKWIIKYRKINKTIERWSLKKGRNVVKIGRRSIKNRKNIIKMGYWIIKNRKMIGKIGRWIIKNRKTILKLYRIASFVFTYRNYVFCICAGASLAFVSYVTWHHYFLRTCHFVGVCVMCAMVPLLFENMSLGTPTFWK